MAVFTCKRCGGTLEIKEGERIAKCMYCGTLQTLPVLDDERRENLYNRASHFRRNNEYDKAMSLYEKILEADPEDAEAYWSIVLCRYGVEYVEDPLTHERIPTINRMQKASILADEDYKQTLKHAHPTQRDVYIHDAEEIARIQKGILEISSKEEPFDVFICYKETDNRGMRTIDSVLAQNLYKELVQEGLKVFFSRITLEDKLGVAYEPYIYAALNSAKVMVVVGTRPENFNAVWVKNEWARYLALVNAGENKTIIPAYRDMDPYDLPDELLPLQAQDMAKIGFMQDLVRGIKKIVGVDNKRNKDAVMTGNIKTILSRGRVLLGEGNFADADKCAERILDIDFENAMGYVLKLFADFKVKDFNELASLPKFVENNPNYVKAYKYANDALRKELDEVKNKSHEQATHTASLVYKDAEELFKAGEYDEAAKKFATLKGYKDAEKRRIECLNEKLYVQFKRLFAAATVIEEYKNCITIAEGIKGYKDVDKLVKELEGKIADLEKKEKIKKKISVGIVVGSVILAIILSVFFTTILPAMRLNAVEKMISNGEYDDAAKELESLRHSDAANMLTYIVNLQERGIDEYEIKLEPLVSFLSQNPSKNKFTINYDFKDSTPSYITIDEYGRHTVTYDFYTNNFGNLDIPTKQYHDFVHWNIDKLNIRMKDLCWEITIDITPVFESKSYNINYELVGGVNNDNPNEYDVLESTTILEPFRKGYDFIGWTGQGWETQTKEIIIPQYHEGDIVLTAHWQAKTFNVKLYDGTSLVYNQNVTYDNEVALPVPTSSDPNMMFAGWYDGEYKVESGTWKVAQDSVLYAKWVPITSVVTFNNTKVDTITVQYSGTSLLPINKIYKHGDIVENFTYGGKEDVHGYKYFIGWVNSGDGDIYSFSQPVTEDLPLYAKWIQMLDKKYQGNDSVLVGKKYIGDAHYMFFVPRVEENITIDIDGITNATIYSYNNIDIEKCTDIVAGETTLAVTPGKVYFIETADNGTKNLDLTMSPTPKSTARVEIADSKIEYVDKETATYTLQYGVQYELITPVREGYTFTGWYNGDNLIPSSGVWNIKEDVTLEPRWNANTYKATLDANGGSVSMSSINTVYDTEVTLPVPTIADDSKEFVGWYFGEMLISNGKWTLNQDVTLVAKWQTKRSTITYQNIKPYTIKVTYHVKDSNSDIYRSDVIKEVPVGSAVENWVPDNRRNDDSKGEYDRTNHIFAGWYKDEARIEPYMFNEPGISNDIELYAKWNYCDVNNYELLNDYAQHTTSAGNFAYVAFNNERVTFTTNKKYDMTVRYSDNRYENVVERANDANTIIFDAQRGESYFITLSNITSDDVSRIASISSSNPFVSNSKVVGKEGKEYFYDAEQSTDIEYIYGNEYDLIKPNREGYAFGGWYDGTAKLPASIKWNSGDDKTYTAKWTPNTYKVTLKDHDDSSYNETINIEYDAVQALPILTRVGYEFEGWMNGDTLVTGTSWKIAHDVTLFAKWHIKDYSVVYNNSQTNSISVTYYSTLPFAINNYPCRESMKIGEKITYKTPEKASQNGTYYHFVGWYKDREYQQRFNFDEKVDKDIDLYAKWITLKDSKWNDMCRYGTDGYNDKLYFVAEKKGNIIFKAFEDLQIYKLTSIDANGMAVTTPIAELKNGEKISQSVNIEDIYLLQKRGWTNKTAVSIEGDAAENINTSMAMPNSNSVASYSPENYNSIRLTYRYNEKYKLMPIKRDGYTFTGWLDDSTGKIISSEGAFNFDRSLSLTPQWEQNTYYLTIQSNSGDTMFDGPKKAIHYGDYVGLNRPVKAHYEFLGWHDGEKLIPSNESYRYFYYDRDVVLNGVWRPAQSEVCFENVNTGDTKVVYHDGDHDTVTRYYSLGDMIENIKPLTNRDLSRYRFIGWYRESAYLNMFNFNEQVSERVIHLYAKWEESAYTFENGVPQFTSSTEFSFVAEADGSASITRTLPDVANAISKFTLKENGQLVKEVSGSTMTFNTKAGKRYNISTEYNYSKWYNVTITWSKRGTNTSKVVIPTGVQQNSYNSTLDSYIAIVYDETYNLPTPTREGYTFQGYDLYSKSGELLASNIPMSGVWNYEQDVVLKAIWA